MPVSVIVGGQYGSEGKGKVAHFIAQSSNAKAAVRVGGPNSGHTVITDSGQSIIFRQLPTAAILPNVLCVIPAGSYIDIQCLLREIHLINLADNRLVIDPNAVIVGNQEVADEARSRLHEIGSTLTGTGAAVSRRIARDGSVSLASSSALLHPYIKDTTPILRNKLDRGERVVIEGTQGFGLSLLHSRLYPYATSRDTTAAAFVSEAGLSPLDVDDVVLVIRTHPIRVAGNSGPLTNEMSWSEIGNSAGSDSPLDEFTSVTKKLRRVGRFEINIVQQSITYNRPTRIALNHIDHIDNDCARLDKLTQRARDFISWVEKEIGQTISLVGFSPAKLVHYRLPIVDRISQTR